MFCASRARPSVLYTFGAGVGSGVVKTIVVSMGLGVGVDPGSAGASVASCAAVFSRTFGFGMVTI